MRRTRSVPVIPSSLTDPRQRNKAANAHLTALEQLGPRAGSQDPRAPTTRSDGEQHNSRRRRASRRSGARCAGAAQIAPEEDDTMRALGAGILMMVALVATGCASMDSSSGAMMTQKPLYDRLGGKPAIQAVVDDFIGNVAGDR